MKKSARVSASFRDPSGFLFIHEGTLYRQINHSYREDWELLNKSGLAKELIRSELLLPYRNASSDLAQTEDAYQIIQPEPVGFVSYPYEWCFGQLKDAALLTLKIQKIALEHGVSLKDASAYNIQFVDGKPALIDHLSFEKYEEKPWVA
ncbi:MAG: SAM-dependent methyltransferase, partial [Patescibacteria group bacterium]